MRKCYRINCKQDQRRLVARFRHRLLQGQIVESKVMRVRTKIDLSKSAHSYFGTVLQTIAS